jgi:hypothetical protein
MCSLGAFIFAPACQLVRCIDYDIWPVCAFEMYEVSAVDEHGLQGACTVNWFCQL